ncbi:MAG: phosphate/phosphite/phosphonate ABC transporter substrate-binding protein [Gammaproteobacteria bacterium]|nr:phosphate/phosphite/phosphonate ABC transporter substrate-binding protein [Gammaproteobacteria bacterium]
MAKRFIITFVTVLLFYSNIAFANLNVYFFYPDSPISNLSQLKKEVDTLFLNANFKINFQPFIRLSDFKEQIKKQNNAILLSPEWAMPTKGAGKILLNGFAHGKPTYDKVLIIKSTSNLTIEQLKGKTHAMTSMGDDVNLFNAAFNNKLTLNEINVIEVNKDVDAMFAVALTQVDSALVTELSLERVKNLNPRIIELIKVIAKSRPLSLPSIMSSMENGAKKEVKDFVEFMKNLKNRKQNPFLKLLKIDEWREVK